MSHLTRSDDLTELHQCIDSAMTRLSSIWDNIGIMGEQRVARRRVVQMHLCNLLDEMAREEDQLRTRLMNNIDKCRAESSQLCVELDLPLYEPPEGLTVLQLEKDLRSHVEALSSQKQNRLRQLKLRSKVDQQLSERLGTEPFHINSGVIPTEQQLAELETHIKDLELEQSKRHKLLTATRQNIMKLLDKLELSPNTSFERDLVCDVDTVLLTSENIQAIKRYSDELKRLHEENSRVIANLWDRVKSLWDRVEVSPEDREKFKCEHQGVSQRTIQSLKEEIGRCEVLKLDNIQHVIKIMRSELNDWWDKCCIAPDERLLFTPLQEDCITEEVLVQHEHEIKRLREYYEDHQDLFDKVAYRQKLWAEFLDLELKANNPDRFLNRGCSLLKEEKARKKLTVELPKVDQEILCYINCWEEQNDRHFYVYGLSFDDYIKKLHSDYDMEKENEKVMRHQLKARQMEEEILYGSKPAVSGTKRFAGNTPTKTPNKLRKVTDTPKTPLGQRPKYGGNFYSPMCLPPRSASKEKLHTASNKPLPPLPDSRRTPFAEHTQNTQGCVTMNSQAPPSTTIVAAPSCSSNNDLNTTGFSIGPYDEFASGLNHATKHNCRSTLAPQAAAFF